MRKMKRSCSSLLANDKNSWRVGDARSHIKIRASAATLQYMDRVVKGTVL